MAATDEVMTKRFTPAALAARNARSAPSRAGTIRSFASLGTPAGSGEARCAKKPQPAVASAHPASAFRSAAKNLTRLLSTASSRRTAASLPRLRTVVCTIQPSATSCRMRKPAM